VYWDDQPARAITAARAYGMLHRQADGATAIFLTAAHPMRAVVQAIVSTFIIWMILVVMAAVVLPPQWGTSIIIVLCLGTPVLFLALLRIQIRTTMPRTLLTITEHILQAQPQWPSYNWLRILQENPKRS
jgi:hypothetical protein